MILWVSEYEEGEAKKHTEGMAEACMDQVLNGSASTQAGSEKTRRRYYLYVTVLLNIFFKSPQYPP